MGGRRVKRGVQSSSPVVVFRAKRELVAESRSTRVNGWKTNSDGFQIPILEETELTRQPTPGQREPPKKRIPPIVITEESMFQVPKDVLDRNDIAHSAKMGGSGVKIFTEDSA